MKYKYRVVPGFSQQPFTGFPEIVYYVERKKMFRRWEKFNAPFDTETEALIEIELLRGKQ